MIEEARNRGLRVLLATVPPANPATDRGRQRYQAIPLLNAEIRQLAAGVGTPLVDVFAAFSDDFALFSADGVHPNADGYALIAATFFDVIRRELGEATPISAVSVGPATAQTRIEAAKHLTRYGGSSDREEIVAAQLPRRGP